MELRVAPRPGTIINTDWGVRFHPPVKRFRRTQLDLTERHTNITMGLPRNINFARPRQRLRARRLKGTLGCNHKTGFVVSNFVPLGGISDFKIRTYRSPAYWSWKKTLSSSLRQHYLEQVHRVSPERFRDTLSLRLPPNAVGGRQFGS